MRKPIERDPIARIGACAVAAVLLAGSASAGETTCQDDGRYTRCWDAQTGATISTTERGAGGYAHTWTPEGHAWTTWEHDELSHTWKTR
jgi:hypothetical protein